MFSFTRSQRRTTAFSLLVLFVGALLMAGACAVWCGPSHRGVMVAVVTGASGPSSGGAHSCCAAKAAQSSKAAQAQKPAGAASEKPDCCRHDKVGKLVAMPDGPMAKLIKLALPDVGLLPDAAPVWPAHLGEWAVEAPVRLVPPHHLPPKIPDCRVFFRSLIV